MLEQNCSLLLSRGPTAIDGFWNLWYNRKKLLSQRCVKKKTMLGTSWFHLSLLAVTAHSLKHILHLRESKCPIEREPLCMFEPNDGCLLIRSRTPISIVYWRKPLWMKVGEGLKIYVFPPLTQLFHPFGQPALSPSKHRRANSRSSTVQDCATTFFISFRTLVKYNFKGFV